MFKLTAVFSDRTNVFISMLVEVERLLSFVCGSYKCVVIVESLANNMLVYSCEHSVPLINVLGCLTESNWFHVSLEFRVVEPGT